MTPNSAYGLQIISIVFIVCISLHENVNLACFDVLNIVLLFLEILGKGVTWGCENTCFYKQKHCGPLSFSEDGTILGVGFQETLVLWDLYELKVCASLSSPSSCDPLMWVTYIFPQIIVWSK